MAKRSKSLNLHNMSPFSLFVPLFEQERERESFLDKALTVSCRSYTSALLMVCGWPLTPIFKLTAKKDPYLTSYSTECSRTIIMPIQARPCVARCVF